MFFFRKKEKTPRTPVAYDHTRLKPAIRSSICTGERVAGFQDLETGTFREIQLLRSDSDLEEFLQTYGLRKEDVPIIY